MAGLHDIAPIVSNRWVISAVFAPIRAAAEAASQPAWPPPMTMTSYRMTASVNPLPDDDPHQASCPHQTELTKRIRMGDVSRETSICRYKNLGKSHREHFPHPPAQSIAPTRERRGEV